MDDCVQSVSALDRNRWDVGVPQRRGCTTPLWCHGATACRRVRCRAGSTKDSLLTALAHNNVGNGGKNKSPGFWPFFGAFSSSFFEKTTKKLCFAPFEENVFLRGSFSSSFFFQRFFFQRLFLLLFSKKPPKSFASPLERFFLAVSSSFFEQIKAPRKGVSYGKRVFSKKNPKKEKGKRNKTHVRGAPRRTPA